MREIIADNSILLKDDDWVQLRLMRAPEKNINGYTYSHEIRCDGQIVCFICYKSNWEKGVDFQLCDQVLLRNEAVPCWELDSPLLSAFTGGMEKNMTPLQVALKELKEEAGYIIEEGDNQRIKELGISFATKSCDTVYHLFAFDVTAFPEEKMVDLTIETDLEKKSTNVWIDRKDVAFTASDPFASLILARLLK